MMRIPLVIVSRGLRGDCCLRKSKYLITDRPVYVYVWTDDYAKYKALDLPVNYEIRALSMQGRDICIQEKRYLIQQDLKDMSVFMSDDDPYFFATQKSGKYELCTFEQLLDDFEDSLTDDVLAGVNANWHTSTIEKSEGIAHNLFFLNFQKLSTLGIVFDNTPKQPEDVDVNCQLYAATGKLPNLYKLLHASFHIGDVKSFTDDQTHLFGRRYNFEKFASKIPAWKISRPKDGKLKVVPVAKKPKSVVLVDSFDDAVQKFDASGKKHLTVALYTKD